MNYAVGSRPIIGFLVYKCEVEMQGSKRTFLVKKDWLTAIGKFQSTETNASDMWNIILMPTQTEETPSLRLLYFWGVMNDRSTPQSPHLPVLFLQRC